MTDATGTASPRHDALALVELLTRRFTDGDIQGALALVHPDAELDQVPCLPHGGVHRGHAGLLRHGELIAEHWERTFGPVDRFACGDRVVSIAVQTFTAKATGRAATIEVLEVIDVEDGQVVRLTVFPRDTHALMQTLVDGPGERVS